MIYRDLTKVLEEVDGKFPVITLTGPRQSGKTTLVKEFFRDLPYVSLEDIDIRNNALRDPRGFLSNFPNGAVLDEVQRTPELFSYIQGLVDEKRNIRFVLTGSQNFQLLQSISQSLAGRTVLLKLLPFSLGELSNAGIRFNQYEEVLFKGMYPGIYDKEISSRLFYPSYTGTYIEKDVRQIKNIGDLNSFSRFIQLCAGRTGQILNMNSLAIDAGISVNTAKSWLSVLEASYIIYFLQPYHKNFNKRIIKSPKLYFYDTGLVCSLLGIENEMQVKNYYGKGALFENLIVNEFLKDKLHNGFSPRLYFWQNKTKQEVDLVVEEAGNVTAYEIKSAMTMNDEHFSNLKYWQKLSGAEPEKLNVIFGGESNFKTSAGNYISWKNIGITK
ncbi:MAG: ATP-binding protein [Draconibacterium sp.]